MIASLYNVPRDPISLSHFSFHNRDQHDLAVQSIFRQTGVMLPVYPIDPMPGFALTNWFYNHQAMHNSVNAALGLQGNDLTDVDPQKLDQLVYWIQLHASEHVAWGNALGIG